MNSASLLVAIGALSLLSLDRVASAQEESLPARQAGVTRIGIVTPKVQMGAGESPQAADAVRNILAEYLQGPTIEVALLSSRLASQYTVEAQQAECDYVLATSLVHRRGKQGTGFSSALSKLVGQTAYIPGMDYAAGAVVTGVLSTAADFAATVEASDEMTLGYQLQEIGIGAPMLDSDAKRRAKADGEDILTPLIETAAEAVGAAIAK